MKELRIDERTSLDLAARLSTPDSLERLQPLAHACQYSFACESDDILPIILRLHMADAGSKELICIDNFDFLSNSKELDINHVNP